MAKLYDEQAVRELKLYEENNSQLYRSSKMPIYQNLDKKKEKGTYDSQKAEVLFKYHADRTAKSYQKEFYGKKEGYTFSVETRKQLAKELKKEYEEERS